MKRLVGALAALVLSVSCAHDAAALARFCTRTDTTLAFQGPYAVVAADLLDNDGVPDIAITYGSIGRRLVLYRNDGTGLFTQVDPPIAPPAPDTGMASTITDPAAIVAADFDEDGWQDLAGTNRSQHYFAFLNPQGGAWGTPAAADSRRGNGTDMVAALLGADRALDLVTVTDTGQVGIAKGDVDGAGNPTGTWGTVSRFSSTSATIGVLNDVEVAELTGDGLNDVLTVDNQYGQLAIWPGNPVLPGYIVSDPIVVPVQDASGAPLAPIEAFLDDWTGDGRQDALVATTEGYLLFFPGTGDLAAFGLPTRIDLVAGLSLGARMPTEWTSVLYQDIVGNDGIRDLVVADAGEPTSGRGFNWISIIPGVADAPARPAFDALGGPDYAAGNLAELRPQALAVADFDGDGDGDIVALNGDAGSMTLLRNDGAGGFDAAPSFTAGTTEPRAGASGRLDADAREDVVIVATSPTDATLDTAILLRATGQESLSAPQALASALPSPVGVAVGSIDSSTDSLLDVLASFQTDQVLWTGNGDGTFDAPRTAAGAAGFIVLADLSGTPALDFASVDATDRLSAWEGDGAGGFTLRQSLTGVQSGQDVAAGRLFGGARPDIVVSGTDPARGAGLYLVRWDDATGAWLPPVFVSSTDLGLAGTSFPFIESADVDGDGSAEILAVAGSGEAYVLQPSGTTVVVDLALSPIFFGASATGLVVRDLTADGILDIAVSDRSRVNVREGTGSGTFAPVVRMLSNISTQGLVAADLDGDGLPELVAIGLRTSDLTVFCNLSVGSLRLRVGAPFTRDTLWWTAQGTATFDVATGVLNDLWRDDALTGASCLANDVSPTTYPDARPLPPPAAPTLRPAYWYLVRCAGGDCSAPDFGATSDGRPRFGPASPGAVADPCP